MLERRQRRSLISSGKIGKYQLGDVVQSQSGRSLFFSSDPFLDRNVAIKVIELLDPNGVDDASALDSFFSEARAIGRLQHPNIVSVYDAGMGDYEGYIVMEFVRGQSLLAYLNKHKRLELDEVFLIAEKLCAGIGYAHVKSVIHRDIKPSNIMLTDDNDVKIVDFGISSVFAGAQSGVIELKGSPSYMAPELIGGASPNAVSDLFSLAVMLFEMITGKLPFSGTDAPAVMYKVVNDEPESIDKSIISQLPQLSDFFSKALSKNPSDRYQTAAEIGNALANMRLCLQDQSNQSVRDSVNVIDCESLFSDCEQDVLDELKNMSQQEMLNTGMHILDAENSANEDYFYILSGKVLLVDQVNHYVLNAGQWIIRDLLEKNIGIYSCKTLNRTEIIRLSKSNLNKCSDKTKSYFYQHVLNKFNFLSSST